MIFRGILNFIGLKFIFEGAFFVLDFNFNFIVLKITIIIVTIAIDRIVKILIINFLILMYNG